MNCLKYLVHNLMSMSGAKLKILLLECQDVFAKDDYDLCNFTDIDHSIDTGDSLPIKQRIRRGRREFEEYVG